MPYVTRRQYQDLLAFRVTLRRFTRWSDDQALNVGLTSAQHQLLLAVKGHHDDRGPTISEVADYLLLRHHSVVELVNRAEAMGHVQRWRDDTDGRLVRLALTDSGEERISMLSSTHLEELRRLAPALQHLTES